LTLSLLQSPWVPERTGLINSIFPTEVIPKEKNSRGSRIEQQCLPYCNKASLDQFWDNKQLDHFWYVWTTSCHWRKMSWGNPQTHWWDLALRTLSRMRGWSTGVTGRKETLLIEKGWAEERTAGSRNWVPPEHWSGGIYIAKASTLTWRTVRSGIL
jgi:hypothetical protein